MADSAVSFVLGRLGEFVVKEAGVLKEVGNDVMLLRDKLEWLHTFVQEADQKRRQRGNVYMDVWVQQTRHVALEVEDVLDEFMLRVDLHQGLPTWKKWFKFLTACATQISVRHELYGRIAMIRARLDQIALHRDAYITEHSSSSATRAATPSISTIGGWDDEPEVIGFDEERLFLERLLLEGDKRRSIVLITGESGIGKSTLALMVFDSPVVRRQFKARAAWNLPPCVTEADALYAIYRRLCPSAKAPATVEEIHGALTEHLKERSYLIVLNGTVKLFNWSSVLDALPDNGLGSRVVIINSLEDNEAAPIGLSVHVLIVHHLEEKYSNLLFRHNALGSGDQQHRGESFGSKDLSESEYEKQMEEACKDIFEITNGLPLAIVLLGRLLRRKDFPDHWGVVLKHLKSMKRSNRLEAILALSFDDLPQPLKSCFLYFTMIPQNMNYYVRRLVQLWAAEGFLKPKKGETMEDVGHNYLEELISRGMVRIVGKKQLTSDDQRVSIHQRLNVMARFETQEGSILDIYDNTDVPSSTAVRHLFIEKLSAAAYSHMEDASFPKLRSVSCAFSEYWEKKYGRSAVAGGINTSDRLYHNRSLRHFGRSKLLRVMVFRGLQVKRLPHVIGSLIHLRYLRIESSCLVELPSTIANLINLQTLDIKGTRVEKVARAFWVIPTLRHVCAENLHLPKSVGVLKNIQTLEGMVCAHPWHNNISPLHNMINLRHLQISKLTLDHWGALADAFKQLESLLSLHLAGDGIPFALFTKFTLRRLQNLKLSGRIVMSAQETEERCTLPNLMRLALWFSRVNQGFINKIGKLPCLVELVLSDESYDGEKLVFSRESGFGNLTDLALYNLPLLSEWKIGLESLPKVKRINVAKCTNMRLKLEGEQVLENLREFSVIDMPDSWGVEEGGALNEKIVRFNLNNKD
uniref:Uncharacterized protein n=1 Tax=Arundo donax TaxID=35708 RepID=A0A0A9AJU9_ARUDO